MTEKGNDTSNDQLNKLLELDACISKIEDGYSNGDELRHLRGIAKDLIAIVSNESIDPSKSFGKVLKAAHNNPQAKKFTALLMLRLLSVQGSLPSKQEDPSIEQNVAHLVENALPEFDKIYKFSHKNQTYEKITQMEQVHNSVMENLLPLKHIPLVMRDVVSQKEVIYRTINNGLVKSYLRYYDYSNIQNKIRALFARADELLNIDTERFGNKLDELKSLVTEDVEYCNSNRSFISQDYFLPLLESFKEATNQLDKDSTKKLDCSIKPKKSTTYKAEKRYPLHDVEREVKVTIPLVNTGPGIARDVNAVVHSVDEGIAFNEELNLGEIKPGEFPFTLNVLILEPAKEISFDVDLAWYVMGQSEPRKLSFNCNIQAQDPDIDWGSLTYEEPYSTEIAEGEEFVGRKQKVAVIAKRLLKPRMQSCYITGQKRIGKTSLALAAIQAVKTVDHGQNIEAKYIEWGDVAHADSEKCVEALGHQIASFFEQYLPQDEILKKHNYHGSLAPLNLLASALREKLPHKKFVIVLDEFDEIPQEMYRYGPLAEAFFSNLRTLSSKINMAFMLVGGEKMPFIMGAQGDQLNKFVGERLDYFSKTDEYNDYVELVKMPVQQLLSWSEGAIEELFYLTNGHPFYTKLICSSIFNSAVSNRDADISTRDVRRTVENLACQFGVNQFAHHWKDGISKIDQEESISLDRCRVLVAIGRAMRRHKELNYENISKFNHSSKLGKNQIKPFLDDFCRRNILKEENGQYDFVVPLFGMWLEQTGVDGLIADRFGDELAASIEEEEENARISSSEIIELVKGWSAYRGSEITAENVRSWLEQLESFKDQRLLFTLLRNLRFVTESEIREKLRLAHDAVRTVTPIIVIKNKRQKRNDIIVTYVDGEAKSGQYYASRYAEENKIAASCVISPVEFTKRAKKFEENNNVTVNGIVIVDDVVATGDSLSNAVKKFVEQNRNYIEERSISLVVVVLIGTKKGIGKVERTLGAIVGIIPEIRIIEPLEDRYYAFAEEPGIWPSEEDFQKAKALCKDLGARIYKKNPLGFGDMGLLVLYPTTCPNNTLPIIHGSSKEPNPWVPLFPRPVN